MQTNDTKPPNGRYHNAAAAAPDWLPGDIGCFDFYTATSYMRGIRETQVGNTRTSMTSMHDDEPHTSCLADVRDAGVYTINVAV